MITNLSRVLLGWSLFIALLVSFTLQAQSGKGKPSKPNSAAECEGNCFATEVIRAEINDEGCIEYELKISHDGTCRYELSHYTVALPCGDILELNNSRNWKQEIGIDPTTGLHGFKIDDISSFGKEGDTSFTVNVTVCSDSTCLEKLGIVAYKAGQCIDYDTLSYEVTGGSNGNGDPGDGGDDDNCDGDHDGDGDHDDDDGDCEDNDHDGDCDHDDGDHDGGNDDCDGDHDGDGDHDDDDGDCEDDDHDGGCDHDDGDHDGGNDDCDGDHDGDGDHDNDDGDCEDDNHDGDCDHDDDGDHDDDDNDDGDNGGGGSDTTQTCSTLSAIMKVLNTKCFGSSTGSLTVSIEDGQPPFLYRWSTGATDSAIYNLPSGVYSVTITDANGNMLTKSAEVTQPNDILITESVFNPSCSGNPNGSINLTISGGVGGYAYSWNSGATTEDLTNLSAGLYTITVTDSAGCIKQKSIMLTNESKILLSSSVTKSGCGQSNGAINLTVSGGAAPYTYVWDNGATTEDIQNLASGSYKVIVTDAAGCTAQSTYSVSENNTVRINFAVTPAGCFNEAIGAIDITPTGGTAPYTYSWQHGPTSEDLTGLVSGIYRVTVTDQSGCSVLTAINVPKKSIQVSTEIIQPLCSGDSTGSIIITPVDSGIAYTYSWSTGGTSNTISDVPVGAYTVTITDPSGCSRTLSYTLTQPSALAPSATVNNTQCGEEGNFVIDLTVTGGKTPYTYLWSTGAVTQDVQSLNSGNYSVTITDANGCTTTKGVVIDPVTNGFVCTINPPATPLVCGSVGNIISSATTDAQSYQWSITSSDNSWAITTGSTSASVVYTVGNAGSTATFSLTIQKDGCTRTCSYAVTTGCDIRDNNGGGDPSTGDPCVTPDSTALVVIEVPQEEPAETEADEDAEEEFEVSAYPNPFVKDITFEWTACRDEEVRLEILDALGRTLTEVYTGYVRKGERYSFAWTGEGLQDRMYFYKCTTTTRSTHGKLFRK